MEGQSEDRKENTPAAGGGIPVCIVTGLSGAGKSTVLRVFEDMGFFTVDGLPASLAPDMIRLLSRGGAVAFAGIALGMDVRQGDLLDIEQTLVRLSSYGIHPRLLFVTADAAVLMRRYAATRRPHPLEREGMGLEAALETERQRLSPLLNMADIILDTASFSIHDLRRAVQQHWGETQGLRHRLKVNLISFGFKYGVPKEADFVFDLRFLPNPYFVEVLRPLSGRDAAVREYVFSQPWAQEFRTGLFSFIQSLLPLCDADGRYRLSIAVGCTGGRHRSVSVAEELYRLLQHSDYSISLEHRHLELG
ncbi:MAG: RNase adapter RapZ [Betaproteobacteria bacterium]|nr:RNase adapter RapZ [Betaproteobacteria bacterium]